MTMLIVFVALVAFAVHSLYRVNTTPIYKGHWVWIQHDCIVATNSIPKFLIYWYDVRVGTDEKKAVEIVKEGIRAHISNIARNKQWDKDKADKTKYFKKYLNKHFSSE